METLSLSQQDTGRLASELAQRLRAGDCVLLWGTLGMGKSVFARALVRTLMADPSLDVPSPTFTLVQTYETPDSLIHHYDLYRLEDPEEIFPLGWEESLGDGITLVEWPERLGPYRPALRYDVHFSPVAGQPDARQISITRHDPAARSHDD